jgi:hypothetical protein
MLATALAVTIGRAPLPGRFRCPPQPARGSRRGEGDGQLVAVPVAGRQVAAVRYGLTAGGNVGVLGEEHRCLPAPLEHPGQRDRCRRGSGSDQRRNPSRLHVARVAQNPRHAIASRGGVLARTRAFFGPRAAGWGGALPTRRPRLPVRCRRAGTRSRVDRHRRRPRGPAGRWRSSGPRSARSGTVMGVDLTPKMLGTAAGYGRGLLAGWPWPTPAACRCTTARSTPCSPPGCCRICPTGRWRRELARMTRPAGRLAVFHPVGRTALAARHDRVPSDDDLLTPRVLGPLLERSGWVWSASATGRTATRPSPPAPSLASGRRAEDSVRPPATTCPSRTRR